MDAIFKLIGKFLNIPKWQVGIIVLITFISYSNSLFNNFVWDDPVFIKEWRLIRTFKGIPQILKGAYPASDAGKYRPVKGIVLTLNNKLFGINPFYYHLQGILIHLTTTVLVYAVVKQIFVKRKPLTANRFLPFLTALIFGVHPIHVEAITFITSSTDMLGITFLLASFYFYLKQEDFGKRFTGNFWLSVGFAFLAFVTNEITLVLPLLLVLYDLCFKHDFKIPALKFYSPFFLLSAGVVFFRYFVLKIGSYTGGYFADSIMANMLLMPKVFAKYIQLLIFPVNLSVNHEILDGNLALRYVDFNPDYASRVVIGNPQVYLSALFIITLLVFAIIIYRKAPVISFLIGWFFISLVPVSNIIPINILLAERYAYLASFAACLGLSLLFIRLSHLKGLGLSALALKTLALILVLFVTILFSVITFMRNFDWKSEKSLWLKTVKQVPDSIIANNDLGVAYLSENENELALKHLEKAITTTHVYFGKMSISIARAYLRLDLPQKALDHLNRAVANSPGNWTGYAYLGETYMKLNMPTKAIENYKISIANYPNYYDARIGLGSVYIKQQKYSKALEQLQTAKLINPYLSASYNNIALIYYKEKKVDEAIAELESGIKATGDKRLRENLQKISGKSEPEEESVVTLGQD